MSTRPRPVLAAAAVLAGLILTILPAPASAPAQPPSSIAPYQASAPTTGALENDGVDGRWLLGGTWLQRQDQTNTGLASGWWRDVSSTVGWSPVTIPNSFNAGNLTGASMRGWVEWYRRDFTLPAGAFAGYVPRWAQSWVVQFESVNYNATVWLNGHELGSHTGAYLPFEFALRYLRGGVNQLIVRVDNQRGPNDFPPGPGGGWWNFGGILDVVYLIPVARAELASMVIRPVLTCPTCDAQINEQATVVNLSSRTQTVALVGSYGPVKLDFGSATIAPGRTWSPTATATVHNPRLWAPGSPNLYRATDRLNDSKGEQIGGYTYLSGIRSITVTGGRLELNGRLLDLRGVNVHEQTVASGAALSVPQQAQLIDWARALGATIIRAHYPLDPEMEEMADRVGILLWSEVPVYQSKDAAINQQGWRQRAVSLLADNIETNQNHPSILLWSIGNELPTPVSAGEAGYIEDAVAKAHSLDPTRPVAMAVSNWPGVPCQAAYAPLQVIGVNEYFGWFDAGGGTDDDRLGLSPYLDSLHTCYPGQALMLSEVGYGGNRSGPVEVRGTYQYQDNELAFSMGVFASKSWLSGAIWFPMQDFAARPGWAGADPLGDAPYVDKGVLDQNGAPKPSFALMSQLYHAVQQIGPPPSSP